MGPFIYFGIYSFLLREVCGWETEADLTSTWFSTIFTTILLVATWTSFLIVFTCWSMCTKKRRTITSPPRLLSHKRFLDPILYRRPRGILEEEAYQNLHHSGFVAPHNSVLGDYNRTMDPVSFDNSSFMMSEVSPQSPVHPAPGLNSSSVGASPSRAAPSVPGTATQSSDGRSEENHIYYEAM